MTITDWTTGIYYSDVLRSTTGQMYTDCSEFSGALVCNSGNIIWNYWTYKYNLSQCASPAPRDCIGERLWWTVVHNIPKPAFSAEEAVNHPHSAGI